MFVDNDNQQEYTLLEPGTHRMKVSGCEVKNEYFFITFKKGGFHTNAFFNAPRLKDNDSAEKWATITGPRGGWVVSNKIWFEEILGKKEVNRVVKEVSKQIVSKYPTFEEQYASKERVLESAAALFKGWIESPKLREIWFDVDLEENLYIDKDGNETKGLRPVKGTVENNYKVPYRVSEDQTEVFEQAEVEQPTSEEVPDWVNETPKREEPLDSEW